MKPGKYYSFGKGMMIWWLVLAISASGVIPYTYYTLHAISNKSYAAEAKARYVVICDSIKYIDDSMFNIGVMTECREAQDMGVELGIDYGVNIEKRKLHASTL